MTDTDSLVYHIETENVYDDFTKFGDQFDFSDFPKDKDFPMSKYQNDNNKKVVGKFKPEELGNVFETFVGLRAKMYSLHGVCLTKKAETDKELKPLVKKTAKGVKKLVTKKKITFDDYERILLTGGIMMNTQCSIRSIDHEIYSTKMNKVSLCAYDDKRYILDDGYTTLAYGHKRIPK